MGGLISPKAVQYGPPLGSHHTASWVVYGLSKSRFIGAARGAASSAAPRSTTGRQAGSGARRRKIKRTIVLAANDRVVTQVLAELATDVTTR
jgi:hypothetical protein